MTLSIGKKKSLPINQTVPIKQMMTPSNLQSSLFVQRGK